MLKNEYLLLLTIYTALTPPNCKKPKPVRTILPIPYFQTGTIP